MILPSTGPLSFSQLRQEFGTDGDNSNGPVRLGQYRSEDPSFTNEDLGYLTNLPLDEGIPTSVSAGTSSISVDNFYGKQLNTVVDLWSGGGNWTYNYRVKQDAFDAGKYNIVGGYKNTLVESDESWDGGKKIIIHINKSFTSYDAPSGRSASVTNSVAVNCGTYEDGTGDWPMPNTTFQVDVGSGGEVFGKGGHGGWGGIGFSRRYWTGYGPYDGTHGHHGSSALGVEDGIPVNLLSSRALLFGGGGGGGGGTGASQDNPGDSNEAGGGGGGGGAGVPQGVGGGGGPVDWSSDAPTYEGYGNDGEPGQDGTWDGSFANFPFSFGGAGGVGGRSPASGSEAVGGAGGAGGDMGQNGGPAGAGRRGTGYGEDGSPGLGGHSIIYF